MKPLFFSHPGRRAGLATLVLAAAIAGCSSDSAIAPDTTGQFSAVVNTGSRVELAGQAGLISIPAADSDTASNTASSILLLQDGKTSAQLGFQWIGAALPATGTYSIGDRDEDVAMAFENPAGDVFDGVSGTVIVSTVDNGVIGGTFSVTAQTPDSTAQTATVTGTFKARIVVQ